MTTVFQPIDSPESMAAAIRKAGIIPFVHNTVPGWSIRELTAPGCWFTDEDVEVLGPWDWKIEVLREGDITYSKCISNKAVFATVECFRHLMNWRRSQPFYRMALGEGYPVHNQMDKLYSLFSPVLLSAIRELGCVGGSDIRKILTQRTTPVQRRQITGHMEKYLIPEVRRTVADYLETFLEMGTWTVVADFERVYKGPRMEYKGWQKSTITTPDELFGVSAESSGRPSSAFPSAGLPASRSGASRHASRSAVSAVSAVSAASRPASQSAVFAAGPRAVGSQPFWARIVDDCTPSNLPDCSPEASRDALIARIQANFPSTSTKDLLKLL